MAWPAVPGALWTALAPIEGVVRCPYLDQLGWVTTAMGYKVDEGGGSAPPAMLSLPWHWFVNAGGEPETDANISVAPKASQAQIADGWQRVKAAQDHKLIGGGQPFWRGLTNLRLDDAGMKNATARWITNAEITLRKQFPQWDNWLDARIELPGTVGAQFRAALGAGNFVHAMPAKAVLRALGQE